MNTVRLTGIAILILAFVVRYYLNNDDFAFWYGTAAGIGAVLVITGRIKKSGW